MFPNGLKKIGAECFYESGLEEAVFPESTREIGASAFNHCRYLKEVQINEGLEKFREYEILDGNRYEG